MEEGGDDNVRKNLGALPVLSTMEDTEERDRMDLNMNHISNKGDAAMHPLFVS